MTVASDPGTRPASGGRISRVAAWIAVGLAAVTVVGHLAARPSPDVAWNLYVTRSLLAGARLGVDVFENTPPMIFLLKAPAVGLAELGGWREWPVWVALVVAFVAAAVSLSFKLTLGPEWRPVFLRPWWAAITTVTLIVVPGGDFGQRDHVTAILILPYLLLTARRAGGGTVSQGLAVLVGTMAAAGIGIKPHYVVLPVVLWLLLARRMGVGAIRTPESAAVCAVGAAYVVAVALLYPGYFAYAAAYGPLYQRFHTDFLLIAGAAPPIPVWAQAALSAGAMPAYVALGAYAAARAALWEDARHPAAVLATATGALLFVALIQGKGWWYHFFPSLTAATLLIVVLVASSAGRKLRPVARLYLATGAGAIAVLVAAALPGVFLRVAHRGDARLNADRNLPQLLPLVAAVGDSGHVAVFSTNIISGFPLVLEGGSRWAFRHPSLWPLVALYEDQVPGRTLITVRDYAARDGLERQFTQDIVDDLFRTKPDMLLVLRPDSTTTRWGGARRFDYLGYFATHPAFRDSVLPSYTAAGAVGDYDVYRRAPKPRLTPE